MGHPVVFFVMGALIFAVGVLTGVYMVYWGPRYWWYKEHGITRVKEEPEPKAKIGFGG